MKCSFSGYKGLEAEKKLIRTLGKWKLFVDGSVAGDKYGACLILTFHLMNNEAKYEALIIGMDLARNLEVRHL